MKDISSRQYDALKEVAQVGMQHAAIGLSKLIGKPVKAAQLNVRYLALEEIGTNLGHPEDLVCMVLIQLSGDISGSMLFVLPNDASTQLLQLWFGDDFSLNGAGSREQVAGSGGLNYQQPILSEFYESALKELSNIAIGAYLTALNQLTGLFFDTSIPYLALDMMGSLLDEVVGETAITTDFATLIDTQLVIENNAIEGYLLMILTPDSMEKIMTQVRDNI